MKNLLWLAALLGLSCAHRIDPAALRLAAREGIEISPQEKLTTPAQVKGDLADLSKIKKEKRTATLLQFLQENPEVFKIQSAATELHLLRSDDDELGFTHYRYARLLKEVPVFGDELILHVNKEGQLYMVNGHYHPTQVVKSEPALSSKKAGAIALEQGKAQGMQSIEKSGLVFYPVQGALHLAWEILLSGGMNKWVYFVDAQDGAVLFDQDRRRF